MKLHLTKPQASALIILRIFIGWHFFYEGITKLYNPLWTAKAYLASASGPLKGLFIWLSTDGLVGAVDFLNVFGLLAVGAGLILGVWERAAALGGLALLVFYYLSQPPLPGLDQVGTEGNYFLINKNLIEAAGMLLLYMMPTGQYFGLRLALPAFSKTQSQPN